MSKCLSLSRQFKSKEAKDSEFMYGRAKKVRKLKNFAYLIDEVSLISSHFPPNKTNFSRSTQYKKKIIFPPVKTFHEVTLMKDLLLNWDFDLL